VKILVAIANYGSKNLKFLQLLLSEYQRMPFDVDIVILSNDPKDLGENIEVRVGLPVKDPWSLPFAHKPLFAERIKDYDLFIYSEDDTLITEKNIRAFLDAAKILPRDEIAGFLRYETGPDGERHISTAHGRYHWLVDSVKQIGGNIFARFTNAHSACYILTRDQLDRAIASGGFLVPPYEGEYDMLCSAATDPYTRCGFNKVVNLSRLEDFLLPHLPNKYVGALGTAYAAFLAQVEALKQIAAGKRPATRALPGRQLPINRPWLRNYYEPCCQELIGLVPKQARSVLSLPIGTGATECELARLGFRVTAIPLDSVICAAAESKGVELMHFELAQAPEKLRGRRFDCLVLRNVLYLHEHPASVLLAFASLLADGGRLLVMEPNFGNLQTIGGRLLNRPGYQGLGCFQKHGITPVTTARVRRWLQAADLRAQQVIHIPEAAPSRKVQQLQVLPPGFSSSEFIVAAQHQH
jgi:SAM-dependent methyltransferase